MGDRRRDTDDVGDRVVGAHLVKRHPIDAGAMQLGLHLGDAREDVGRQRARVGIEPRAFEQPLHLRVVAVIMRVRPGVVLVGVIVRRRAYARARHFRLTLGARSAGPGHVEAAPDEGAPSATPEGDPQPAHTHGVDRAPDDRGGDAGVDQRRHRHVPSDSRRRLEVQMQAAGGHVAGVRFRLSMDAIRPAPNPLSMFTTATPDAQEFSIPSSAATPPKLAP